MIKCAIIENGVVVNLIEYASVPVGCPDGYSGDVFAVAAENSSIGWRYENGAFVVPEMPTQTLSYQQLRRPEYPPVEDYLDGIVKNDQQQIQDYIDKCLAVKAKYPKINTLR